MEKLLVGLGNPGEKYATTRHNIGFMVLDSLANKKELIWQMSAKLDSLICTKDKLTLLKPQTFMNDSGTAVSKFLNFYKLNAGVLTVIHDDVDLPFGKIKKQYGPGSAGHRGVEDIIDKLGTQEFWRIRIGVGRSSNTNIDTPDWVLSSFSDAELAELDNIAEQVEKLVF